LPQDQRQDQEDQAIHIYPKVDHGFVNDERPDVYDKAAAEDAWKRTLAHFAANLK